MTLYFSCPRASFLNNTYGHVYHYNSFFP
jgi:hypothetical protein